MCRNWRSRSAVFVLFVSPSFSLAQDLVPAETDRELLSALASSNRLERTAALDRVEKMVKIPDDVFPALIRFVEAEAEWLRDPTTNTAPRSNKKALGKFPFVGDETPVAKIKADPEAFIGKQFWLGGGVRIQNYYLGGYSNAGRTHLALDFAQVSPDGEVMLGADLSLYILRDLSLPLADDMVRASQNDSQKGRYFVPVRLFCQIDPKRVARREIAHAFESIEVLDWQRPTENGKGWQLSSMGGISGAMGEFAKAGEKGIPFLVNIMTRPERPQKPAVDITVRVYAASEIDEMGHDARMVAAYKLGAVMSETRDHGIYENLKAILEEWRIDPRSVRPEAVAATKAKKEAEVAKANPALKAGQWLKQAKTLEPLNRKAAIETYRKIVEQAPETPEAATAKSALKRLGD